MRTRHIVSGLVLAVSTSLASCGEPRYEYVRNTEARTAFKIPNEWTLFDEAAMLGEPEGTQASTPDPVEWLVGLDGDPSPAREHVLNLADGYDTTYPHGIAGVYRLSTQVRDRVNLGVLRNLIIPIDQIRDEVGAEAISVKAYDDRLNKDGFRGLHFEAQVLVSALETVLGAGGGSAGAPTLLSDDYLHINQTAYMDPSSDKVYVLAVLCSADCYARNSSEIRTVVDSWAVIA
ncbi:MAG TPA: hypothetical protein VF351_03370 [Actinomycetota bacterium]